MTNDDVFTAALAAGGYHYDPHAEEFRHGQRVVGMEELIRLVPGMSRVELAQWQDDKFASQLRRRALWRHARGRGIMRG